MSGDPGRSHHKVGPFDHTDKKPKRESLCFDVNTTQLPTETAHVVLSIKRLAEGLLFHWKSFPIVLPDSITDQKVDKEPSDENPEGAVKFRDLFVTPTFDELEAVATDEHGKLKKLNNEQLAMIRTKGEFEVTSINFAGQVHRWRLTNLLQKGRERTTNSFLGDMAKSLSLLIITARNRFCDDFFSLRQGVRGWYNGFWNILDIIIGVPSTTPGDVCQKLEEERMNYLIAELNIKPSFRKELDAYCGYIKMHSQPVTSLKENTADLRPPPIPYRYQTPNGQEIDLRLFNTDLINNSIGILSNILDRQAKGWHVQMRTKLIKHYQGQHLSNEEISKRVTEDMLNHYLERVFQAVSTNAELNVLQPGIGELLVDQAKSVLAMMKAQEALRQSMEIHKEELIDHLKKAYPVKSRISAWMKEQVAAFESDFARQNQWTAHLNAITLCEEQGLHQTVYFLRRDLTFIKERDTVLKKELSKVKISTRTFQFSTKIWFPHNWVVKKWDDMGRSEVIPTTFRDVEPPVSKDRSERKMLFTVDKLKVRQTSTRYPFWRWWNYLHRTWSSMWNLIYLFGIIIPWCSPLGLRALFWPSVFVPDMTQSGQDGSLYPRQSSATHTLVSRLRALWANVRRSRVNFETTPDRGFLGKSLTRHFNRVWNYFLKGAVGSVLIVTVFPVLCLTVSTASVMLAILAPLWVPIGILLLHVLFFLFWDIDSPRQEKSRLFILFEAVIFNILIQGVLYPISAILVGALVCPIAAFALSLFGVIRRGTRLFWDTVMFHTIVKTKGRVPSSNSFVARRIAGPGLASNYFYQIRPEQALAAVESTIEQDELNAWKKQTLAVVEEPCEAYRRFVDQCFVPFSANLSQEGTYLKLSQETQKYTSQIRELVGKRLTKLYTGLNPDLQRKIKLPEQDLKLSIVYTAKMLEELYPSHVLQRADFTEDEFWEGQGLEYRDWQGLASKKLSQIFSPTFLVPLEETDNCFQLKVNHMNVRRYGKMLATASFHDDLDLVVELHTPQGDLDIQVPYLDILYFDPTKRQTYASPYTSLSTPRCGRSRHDVPTDSNKLRIPVPILHPAHIAVAVYNRENDHDPIDTRDGHIQHIIRASKEVPFIDFNELSSLERSNTEELSTPDNLTTESFTLTSHLATQEPSISEDAESDLGGLGAVGASIDNQNSNPQLLQHKQDMQRVQGSRLRQFGNEESVFSTGRGHDRGDGRQSEEEEIGLLLKGKEKRTEEEEEENYGGHDMKTVYCEIEKDTSCVVDTG